MAGSTGTFLCAQAASPPGRRAHSDEAGILIILPAMCFNKSYGFRSVLSNTNGRVWGFCLHLCSNMAGQNRREKTRNKAIHIDCPRSGQISSSRREHIEFAVRQTYRLKDWARTATFFTLHFVTGVQDVPSGTPAALPPDCTQSGQISGSRREHIEFAKGKHIDIKIEREP